jgi:serine/threonine-protein kinase
MDNSGLSRVSAAGGASVGLTTLDSTNETAHRWPEFLPGGKALIFTVLSPAESNAVGLYVFETGERHLLIPDGYLAHYAPSGHLVYARAGALFAVPFDGVRLETTGPSVLIAGDLKRRFLHSQFSLSHHGWLAYVGGDSAGESTLVWVDRNGAETPHAAPPSSYMTPRLSPDGRLIAVTQNNSDSENAWDIWLYDISGEARSRLTFDSSSVAPRWSPDGKQIVFYSFDEHALVWMNADGAGAPEQLLKSDYEFGATSWSGDGRFLVLYQSHPETDGDVSVLSLDGERKPEPLLQTPADEGEATLSPDGRFLAYVSNVSGRAEVYLQAFPGPGAKWQVSTEGGKEPVWARNGGELFYRSDDRMMAVSVGAAPTFTAAKPRVLFADPYVKHGWFIANYDVSPDGQSFLMVKSGAEEAAQLVLVQNWAELLKPAGPESLAQ